MADQVQGVPEGLTEEKLQPSIQAQGVPEGLTEEPLSTTHTQTVQKTEEPGILQTAADYWTGKVAPKDAESVDYSDPTGGFTGETSVEAKAKDIRNRMAQKGAQVGSEAAAGLLKLPLSAGGSHIAQPAAEQPSPVTTGIAKGIGGTVGGIAADPAMWPLMVLPVGEAAPILSRAISGGFATSMGADTIKGAKELAANWDTLNPEQRAEEVTRLGLGTAFTAAAGTHALLGVPEAAKMGARDTARRMGKTYEAGRENAPGILSTTGAAIGTAKGGPIGGYFGMKAGKYAGQLMKEFLPSGRPLAETGMPLEERNVSRIEKEHDDATKKFQPIIERYNTFEAGRQRGIPTPDDVLKPYEKAKGELQALEAHLHAAKEVAAEAKGTPSAPDQPITPAAVEAARPIAPEEKPAAPVAQTEPEPEAKPEVPAVRKPEPPPIMTAGEPERAPDMKGLKVDETGKVIDTTATETAAREALGTEAPGRKVPATEGVAMRPPFAKAPAEESPLAKYAPEEIAKREAAKPEVPVSEVPKVEAPKAEEAPKEVAERSPEDLSKVDTVIKELPNQDLIRHGSRFGVDETKYDFSKRVALREGGSKHPVEREAHANATLSALPEDLKNHIVDAANDWDAKNPKVFDPASYTNASRAERARAIMNEAMKRYQDGLAAKGVSGGSGAPDKGIGGLERWQGKNPLDKATVKPTADKVNLPADTDKEQPFEAGNQTWEDQLREARKTVNKGKAEAKAEKPKEVGGGTDKPERGGTEEGAKQDTAYFAQAKKELPEGNLSDWAKRAQELKDKGDKPEVLETPKEFKEKPEEPKGSSEHTYEYKRDADSHQVTVRDKDGKSVALIEARAADDDPNTWTVKTSASAEKGEGLKGYTRLMDAAKSQAERSGKPVTVQGDTEMSASAVRTWVKLGRDYDIAWH